MSERYVEAVAEAESAPAKADGFTDPEPDELVGRIALYPDALLAQVLVAATVPFDVVKAGRCVASNTGLPAGEREAAAEAEG